MKVFISWSGKASLRFATALRDWLKCVLQNTEPFLSNEDIRKGSVWFSTIRSELENTGAGIICLTKETINEPWILFEAGAITKGVSKDKVCTILLNFEPAMLRPPLSEFHATRPTAEDMLRLLKSINEGLGQKGLGEKHLETMFNKFWPDLDAAIGEARKAAPETKPHYEADEILPEVLELCRSIHRNQQQQPLDFASALAAGNASPIRPKRDYDIMEFMIANRRKEAEWEAKVKAGQEAAREAELAAAVRAAAKQAVEEQARLYTEAAKKQAKFDAESWAAIEKDVAAKRD